SGGDDEKGRDSGEAGGGGACRRRGVEDAGRARPEAREAVLQSQREGGPQRVWAPADARHALRRTVAAAARVLRRGPAVPEGQRRRLQAQGKAGGLNRSADRARPPHSTQVASVRCRRSMRVFLRPAPRKNPRYAWCMIRSISRNLPDRTISSRT